MPAAATNVISTPSVLSPIKTEAFWDDRVSYKNLSGTRLLAPVAALLDDLNGPTWVIIHDVNINRHMLGCLLLCVATATLVIQRLQVVQYIRREDSAPPLVRQNLVFVLSVPDNIIVGNEIQVLAEDWLHGRSFRSWHCNSERSISRF